MKTIINKHDFSKAFEKMGRENNFSYDGRIALFEYLEQYEQETGEEIELDVIALCCEYTEYESATEAASNYFDFEGMIFDENGDEMETADEVENKALEYLQDRTQVIVFETGIIIQDF